MNDWCAFCDFKNVDDDPQDCTCEDRCVEEGCCGGELSGEETDEFA